MKKIIFILFTLVGCIGFFLIYHPKSKNKIGIHGYIEDEQGNSLNQVIISYHNALISVKTDEKGIYSINEPTTLLVEFKKEGYQTLTTSITNFSENSSYDLKTVTLQKLGSKKKSNKAVSIYDTNQLKNLKLSGQVLDAFKKPIKNVRVTLTDSVTNTISSYNKQDNDGAFHFEKYKNILSFKKEGFRETTIGLPTVEKNNSNITLLEKSNRKGIYIVKNGNYIQLPQIKLLHKSEEKIDHSLWGGNFSYNVTDFFFPSKVKEFKIKNDTIIRFAIFESDFSSELYKVKNNNGYLCTISYRHSKSPSSKTQSIVTQTIYPSEYSYTSSYIPKIIDFKPNDNKEGNYVFVNSENKKGYCFTYSNKKNNEN